jgi:hypothetical protein
MRIQFESYDAAVAYCQSQGGVGYIASRCSQKRVFWYSPEHTFGDIFADGDVMLSTLTACIEYAGHERRLNTPYSRWPA